MCRGCWESYGSPAIVSEKIEHAVDLIAEMYSHSPNGGNLHIHLDDWNLDDSYFDKFVNRHPNTTSKAQLKIEKGCFDFMKSLTVEERASALAMFEGYVE